MITQQESGLTSGQYAALQAATENLAIQVKLQRYGPAWTSHDTNGTRSGANFDAAIASTYLLRVYVGDLSTVQIDKLANESGGDEVWTVVGNTISDVDTDVPPSLVTDGLTARFFYYSTSGKIRYSECADISSGSFGSAQDVATVSDVIQLAAVSTTKVYCITKNTTTNNRRLHFYSYSGSWSLTSSQIRWAYPIYGFDAVALSGYDLLMMASELPPLLGSRVVSGVVSTEVERVQGLVTFRVQNGRWSDHELIDVIDRVVTNPSRASLRLSYFNSTLFATYTRCGGGGDYTYSKLAVSRSKDAIGWEFPELVETATAPGLVLPRSDYLYLVGVDRTLRSPCCAWAGQTPVEQDVTASVLSIESMAAEIRDTTLGIANADDVLDGTLAKADTRVQAVYWLGYVVGGDASDILKAQTSTEDVLMRAAERTLPRHGLSLTTQDRLGRLNRTVSDYAAEWPGHSAGRDPYDDPTGTGYGGLRHTAPYEGSWKAEGGKCHLLSSNAEGIAVSTLVSDALNGSAQTAFMLAHTSKGEYAGITFHVHDKDNLCFAAYYVDDDVIRLKTREGGTDTTLATSGSMSWTIDTWYYIKVMVYYSMAYVFTSTDGVTWSLVSWATGNGELAGMADEAAAPGTSPSGKFGLIGYGYSEKDSYGGWEPEPWEPIIPTDLPDTPSVVLVWSMDQLAVTTDFDAEYPSWTDITPADVDYIHRVWKDHSGGYKVWMLGGETNTDANEGLWYCSDVRTGSWSLVASQNAFRSAAIAAGGEGGGVVACGVSHSSGLFCAAERKAVSGSWGTAVHICNTSGIVSTWWSDDLTWANYDPGNPGTYEEFRCYAYSYMSTTQVVYHNGAIYITGRGRWNPDSPVWTYSHGAYIKSTDGGANWTVYTESSGNYSDNRRPGSLGICGSKIYTIFRDTAEDELMVYDLVNWSMVAPTGDIFQNYSSGAPSRYHPSAFFAPARKTLGAGDYGYVWRDGYEMWPGEDIWEEKSGEKRFPRAFAIYPKGASRAGFVEDLDDTSPPIVKWVDSGGAWDKTGNLMTVLGGSWSGSYGGVGGSQHSYHDNASLLFFWED